MCDYQGDEKNNSITGDANDHVSESSFMNENIEKTLLMNRNLLKIRYQKILLVFTTYLIARYREAGPDNTFSPSAGLYSMSSSVGLSGGILCVWDPNSFATKVMFVSIYAPQDISEKKSLWEYITHIIDTWDGECIILGDFNEVRSKQERLFVLTCHLFPITDAIINGAKMLLLWSIPFRGLSNLVFHKKSLHCQWIEQTSFGALEGMLNASFLASGLVSKVGSLLRRIAWDEIIGKVSNRLSKWKIKTLSVGGRLTLIKSVLTSLPLYHMSLYKAPLGVLRDLEFLRRKFFNGADINEKRFSMISWNKILASKQKGGLGVSSFFALNRSLLFKWVWRFLSQDASLWHRLIAVLYGNRSPFVHTGSVSSLSPWNCILKELNSLSAKGINLLALLKKKVGNGANTLFWEDCWINDVPLSRSFPRLYALELKKGITVADKLIDASFVASFRRETPVEGWKKSSFTI
ncbi:RNA-directed DNA polymerase, eukaryota [Tanacetum coccineum]